jgi:hypothetical protein
LEYDVKVYNMKRALDPTSVEADPVKQEKKEVV